ncbi:site-specific integrase [Rathayibacter sp. VKM Ac-2878]|nr:site-specific integrase [Rathayibacter sp. VKM Ac-2879]MBF4503106.1 site-specific integrase [Rathayibacter sp. VKM Ac-2878]
MKLPKNHDAGQFAPTFLTTAQVEALAGKLSDSMPYDLLIRFAAYTGLRAGELAGLRVQDVDLTRGHVQVRQTMQHVAGEWVADKPKSKRSTRDVPLMHSKLIRDLRRYLLQHPHSGHPSALFWPGRAVGGKHAPDYSRVMDNASFRRNYFRPALAAAKLPDMRVHDLRHTAASLWLAAGFQPYEARALERDQDGNDLCPPPRHRLHNAHRQVRRRRVAELERRAFPGVFVPGRLRDRNSDTIPEIRIEAREWGLGIGLFLYGLTTLSRDF